MVNDGKAMLWRTPRDSARSGEYNSLKMSNFRL